MLGGIMGMMGGGGPIAGRQNTIDDLKGLMDSRQGGDVYADAHYDSVPLVGTSQEHSLTDYFLI